MHLEIRVTSNTYHHTLVCTICNRLIRYPYLHTCPIVSEYLGWAYRGQTHKELMQRCQRALLTGGTGFLGRRLSAALLEEGQFTAVVLLDLYPPSEPLRDGETFIQGSTTDLQLLLAVLEAHSPVAAVFHIAAYGMTGAASLDRAKTWQVNVEGTKNVIAACVAAGVPRLVYTSTCNVVFGGSPIYDGDESSLPYCPPEQHIDWYSKTKTVAEQMVLAANDTPLAPQAAPAGEPAADTRSHGSSSGDSSNSGGSSSSSSSARLLRTCALRPNGIFGAGEQQHSIRVLRLAEAGLLKATFGSLQEVQAWSHVNNVVQAQLLAAAALTAERHYVAAGQAYFIVDREATNSQTFLKPLLVGLGYKWPTLHIPLWLMYLMAYLSETLYRLLPHWTGFSAVFTRSEVRKAAVTHTFSIDKAQRELGYEPESHSAEEYLPWFLQQGYKPGSARNKQQQQLCYTSQGATTTPAAAAGSGSTTLRRQSQPRQ